MIKKLLKMIRNIFIRHCPECKGEMKEIGIDLFFDREVYQCTKCGKEWI